MTTNTNLLSRIRIFGYTAVGCLAAAISFYFQFRATESIFNSFFVAATLTTVFEGFKIGSILWAAGTRSYHPISNIVLPTLIRPTTVLLSAFATLLLCSLGTNLPNADHVRQTDLNNAQLRFNKSVNEANENHDREISQLTTVSNLLISQSEDTYLKELSRWDNQLIEETDNVRGSTFIGERYLSWDERRDDVISRHENRHEALAIQLQTSLSQAFSSTKNEIDQLNTAYGSLAGSIRARTYSDDPRAQHQSLLAFVTSLHAVTNIDLEPVFVGWMVSIVIAVLLESIILIIFSHLSAYIGPIVLQYEDFQNDLRNTGVNAARKATKESADISAKAASSRHTMGKIYEDLDNFINSLRGSRHE